MTTPVITKLGQLVQVESAQGNAGASQQGMKIFGHNPESPALALKNFETAIERFKSVNSKFFPTKPNGPTL
jgi:hypothetical protein